MSGLSTRAAVVATAGLLLVGAGGTASADLPEHRSIDGRHNNLEHPRWGSADTRLRRLMGTAYMDDMSWLARDDMPGTRAISNALCAQEEDRANARHATDMFWQWGQFLDHDIDLTDAMEPAETWDIPVPPGDPVFDPDWTGTRTIPFTRSVYDPRTGTEPGIPRQQLNRITAFIDASQVYGSDEVRAAALRANDGTGRLATSAGDLLPFNTAGLPNAGGPSPAMFLAGDVRANEQVGLASMHTLFVREHNRIAGNIRANNPGLTGDEIYQRARARVGAIMQAITYNEFLPILLGPDAIGPYEGYDPTVHPGIANAFSTVAYRVGHTMLSPLVHRLADDGTAIPEGHLSLVEAFFSPQRIVDEGGIEPILRGLVAFPSQEVDLQVIDEVRNFLFLGHEPMGLDLAALNMQRARDHGIPDYNRLRVEAGLAPVTSFAEITSSAEIQAELAAMYGSVDDIDPWVGMLAEDHVPGAMVGELMHEIITDQFRRLRDGDRFWYESVYTGQQLMAIRTTTLADVIRRNTPISGEIQDRVMLMPSCPGDVDGDGAVNVDDVIIVLSSWGQPGGLADVTSDGVVNIDDLLAVLIAWGGCE
jgi:hypothetical protein